MELGAAIAIGTAPARLDRAVTACRRSIAPVTALPASVRGTFDEVVRSTALAIGDQVARGMHWEDYAILPGDRRLRVLPDLRGALMRRAVVVWIALASCSKPAEHNVIAAEPDRPSVPVVVAQRVDATRLDAIVSGCRRAVPTLAALPSTSNDGYDKILRDTAIEAGDYAAGKRFEYEIRRRSARSRRSTSRAGRGSRACPRNERRPDRARPILAWVGRHPAPV